MFLTPNDRARPSSTTPHRPIKRVSSLILQIFNLKHLLCNITRKWGILPENRTVERERSLWQQRPRKYPRATRKPKTPRYLLYRPENGGYETAFKAIKLRLRTKGHYPHLNYSSRRIHIKCHEWNLISINRSEERNINTRFPISLSRQQIITKNDRHRVNLLLELH